MGVKFRNWGWKPSQQAACRVSLSGGSERNLQPPVPGEEQLGSCSKGIAGARSTSCGSSVVPEAERVGFREGYSVHVLRWAHPASALLLVCTGRRCWGWPLIAPSFTDLGFSCSNLMVFTRVAEETAIPCSEINDQKHCRFHVLLWMVSSQKVKAISLACQAIAGYL